MKKTSSKTTRHIMNFGKGYKAHIPRLGGSIKHIGGKIPRLGTSIKRVGKSKHSGKHHGFHVPKPFFKLHKPK